MGADIDEEGLTVPRPGKKRLPPPSWDRAPPNRMGGQSRFEASSASGDRSPLVSVTCPAMACPLNFCTMVVNPFDVAST